MEPKKRRGKRGWAVAGLIVLSPVILFPKRTYFAANAFLDLWRAGTMDATTQHKYSGDSADNLKALYQAIKLYEESEGNLPSAQGWMDAAKTYVRTNDLKKGEEMKKFVNPRVSSKDGEFGYAFNSKLSLAYSDEVKEPGRTPLIFETTNRSWNASGTPGGAQPNPKLDGGNLVITLDGTVTTMDKLTTSKQDPKKVGP